jgi:hypothetical protein
MLIELPERFLLQLTSDGRVTRQCSTVTWDEGIKTGVMFDRDPSAA